MSLSLGEIAISIDGDLVGDPEHRVSRVREVLKAGPGEICVVWDSASVEAIESSSASAFVAAPGVQVEGGNVIRVNDPQQAMIDLLGLLHPSPMPPALIEDGARVADDATCSEGVYIAAGATVESGAMLGPRVQIHTNAVIGAGVEVGEESVIHPGVVVYGGTRIGRRVVVHSGAVIGSDGFGYRRAENGQYRKIPQVGIVEIEDDVEIGAGTTIDRAALGKTVIGRGTKIDNLVQVAHNTSIGEDCCIVGQAGIAGSSQIGDSTLIGAQAGVSDHVSVGAGVRIGAQAGVLDDLESGDWMGSPAMPAERARRVLAIMNRLPEIYDELRSLRRRCEALENRAGTGSRQ